MTARFCACGCGGDIPSQSRPHVRWISGHNRNKHPDEKRQVFGRRTIRKKTRWYLLPRHGEAIPWARVVMEGIIGRPLRPAEVVHHINGDSEDDRPENLQLFASHSEHMQAEYETGTIRLRNAETRAAREQGECRQGSLGADLMATPPCPGADEGDIS